MPRWPPKPLIRLAATRAISAYSQPFQEPEQGVGRSVPTRRRRDWPRPCHCLFLDPEIGVEIDPRRLDGFMAEPQCDDGAANAPLKKLHCRGVSQAVRAHPLALQRLAAVGCECHVLVDNALDRVAAEACAPVAHEQRLVIRRRTLIKPVPEHLHRVRPERGRARLAPPCPGTRHGHLARGPHHRSQDRSAPIP